MLKQNKKILLGIIIIAAAIRLAAVLKYGDFWDDEMFNFIYSQKPWPEGLVWWLWETNPPLHLLLLKLWFFIVPATEFFARLPSIIAGVASVYSIYHLSQKMFNKNIGLIAALYLALHPYHIFWSSTARVYSLLMLLSIISFYLFWKIFILNEFNSKQKNYSLIINSLLLLSHLTSIFLLGAQCLLLIIFGKFTEIKRWLKINLPALIIGGLWIVLSLFIKSNNNLSSAWFMNLRQSIASAVNPLTNLFSGQYPLILGIISASLGIIIISFATRRAMIEKNISFIAIFIIAILPILFSLSFGVWHIKFVIAILPFFVLLFTLSLLNFLSEKLTAILIVLFCLPGLFSLLFRTLPLTNWRQVENFIQNNKSESSLVVYNNFILKPQIEKYLPQIAVQTKALPLYQDISEDEMVVKKNYLYVFIDEEEKDKWYQAEKLYNYQTIILLQGEYGYMNKLDELFLKNGWRLEGTVKKAEIAGSYNLYVFKNPEKNP